MKAYVIIFNEIKQISKNKYIFFFHVKGRKFCGTEPGERFGRNIGR